LKRLLKRYKSVYDFIIFGSAVKGKMNPNDMDIAVITSTIDPAIIGEIKTGIDSEIRSAHVQVINYGDFLRSKLPYYMLLEGYSVKEGDFISGKLKVSRKVLYTFDLQEMAQTKKVMFNKGLKAVISSTNSEKVGKGALLAPVNKSGEVEDFLMKWKRKIRKKEFIEM